MMCCRCFPWGPCRAGLHRLLSKVEIIPAIFWRRHWPSWLMPNGQMVKKHGMLIKWGQENNKKPIISIIALLCLALWFNRNQIVQPGVIKFKYHKILMVLQTWGQFDSPCLMHLLGHLYALSQISLIFLNSNPLQIYNSFAILEYFSYDAMTLAEPYLGLVCGNCIAVGLCKFITSPQQKLTINLRPPSFFEAGKSCAVWFSEADITPEMRNWSKSPPGSWYNIVKCRLIPPERTLTHYIYIYNIKKKKHRWQLLLIYSLKCKILVWKWHKQASWLKEQNVMSFWKCSCVVALRSLLNDLAFPAWACNCDSSWAAFAWLCTSWALSWMEWNQSQLIFSLLPFAAYTFCIYSSQALASRLVNLLQYATVFI